MNQAIEMIYKIEMNEVSKLNVFAATEASQGSGFWLIRN